MRSKPACDAQDSSYVKTLEALAEWKASTGEAAKTGSPAFVAVIADLYRAAHRRIHGVKAKTEGGAE